MSHTPKSFANTAVFYDLENLTGGYTFSDTFLSNLRLRTVLEAIKRDAYVQGVGIHRAYANWSHPKLAPMRDEILALGITPVQVFGLGRNGLKNVADIQLAVDVIEAMCERPDIEVFAIVSGDGGFGALITKLHERGKYVIGVGYRHASSVLLEAVCDRYITLHAPVGMIGMTAEQTGQNTLYPEQTYFPGQAATRAAQTTGGPSYGRDRGTQATGYGQMAPTEQDGKEPYRPARRGGRNTRGRGPKVPSPYAQPFQETNLPPIPTNLYPERVHMGVQGSQASRFDEPQTFGEPRQIQHTPFPIHPGQRLEVEDNAGLFPLDTRGNRDDHRELRNPRDQRDTRDTRDTREPRDQRDSRESRYAAPAPAIGLAHEPYLDKFDRDDRDERGPAYEQRPEARPEPQAKAPHYQAHKPARELPPPVDLRASAVSAAPIAPAPIAPASMAPASMESGEDFEGALSGPSAPKQRVVLPGITPAGASDKPKIGLVRRSEDSANASAPQAQELPSNEAENEEINLEISVENLHTPAAEEQFAEGLQDEQMGFESDDFDSLIENLQQGIASKEDGTVRGDETQQAAPSAGKKSSNGLPPLELPIRPKTLISRVQLLVAPATQKDATARYIKCFEVANAIAKDEEVMEGLLQSPTNLAFLGDLLRKLMPGFEPKDLGFKKLRDLARFLVQGSDLAIYAAIGNDKLVVLGQREPAPEGFHRFDDVSGDELPPLADEHEALRSRVFAR